MIVNVFGNVDNEVNNEVLDIIVAEDGIEIEDNLNIIEEDEKEGLKLAELNNAISDEEQYTDDQEEDEETIPEEQDQEVIAKIDDLIEEDITSNT